MLIRFLCLLLVLTSVQAHAHQCKKFGGVHHCTHAPLKVTDVAFANGWGRQGPPRLYPSEAAAIAAINASYHPHYVYQTGVYEKGWSESTPKPPALRFPPLGVVWSNFDDYGNVTVQIKAIQMLRMDETDTGNSWPLYQLRKNTYLCPSEMRLIADGQSAKGYPYPMCRALKPAPKIFRK
jgi:hypothetical protein